MATFCGEHIVAGRELALHKETLAMAGTWPEHKFDATFLDWTPV